MVSLLSSHADMPYNLCSEGARAVPMQLSTQRTEAAESTGWDSLFLTRLLQMAMYNISYIRGLFPDKYFNDDSSLPLGMRSKKLMPIDAESACFIDCVEKGVRDGLQKKYLKTVLFSVLEKEGGQMIEEYTFSFYYPNTNMEEVAIIMKRTGSKKESTILKLRAAEATPDKMRSSACKMIREIISLLTTVEPMPEKRAILVKFLYDIETPDDYVPPFVNVCSDNKAINVWDKNPLKLGDYREHNVYLKITIPSNGRDDEMADNNESDHNDFAGVEVCPSEANRYIVALSDDGYHEEQLTTLEDVHRNFPAISMERIEDNFESLNGDLVPRRIKIDSLVNQTLGKFGYLLVVSSKKIKFILDSGATHHICNDIGIMKDIKDVKKEDQVIVYSCNGKELKAEKMGTVVYQDFKLSQVGYIQGMPFNVVSVGQLAMQGLLTSTGEGRFTIIAPDQPKVVGEGFLQKIVESNRECHEYVFRSMDWVVSNVADKLVDDVDADKLVDDVDADKLVDDVDSAVEPEKIWIIDTGCARHMVPDLALLSYPRKKKLMFQGASGTFYSTHEGSVKLEQLHLQNVLRASKITDNLISGPMLDLSGHRITFNSTRCTIVHKDGLKEKGVGIMDRGTRMYCLRTAEQGKGTEESTGEDEHQLGVRADEKETSTARDSTQAGKEESTGEAEHMLGVRAGEEGIKSARDSTMQADEPVRRVTAEDGKHKDMKKGKRRRLNN